MVGTFLRFNYMLISLIFLFQPVNSYEIPPALVEPLLPAGLRVSIPDRKGISRFTFHGNVNEKFENGLELGQMAMDVLMKENERWTYFNRNVKLKVGDNIYYWLFVIKDGLGYQKLFQSYNVEGFVESSGENSTGNITPSLTGFNDCKGSLTKMNGLLQKCSRKLIFDSFFENGISKNWSHIVQFGLDESQFTVFDKDYETAYTEWSALVIKPSPLDDKYGKNFTSTGQLDLGNRCTSKIPFDCERASIAFLILPPVQSARLTTKNIFSFSYGIVEVRAKLPRGDWIVTEIWLQPTQSGPQEKDNGKIHLVKHFGNDNLTVNGSSIGNDLYYSELESGKETKQYRGTGSKENLISRFHNYKMYWAPDQIRFYFDDHEIGFWNTHTDGELFREINKMVTDNEFYLTLGLHVGGFKEFPDNSQNWGKPKPWKEFQVKSLLYFYRDLPNWHSTWNNSAALKIEHVKVWTL